METRCENCGAPMTKKKCDYCGHRNRKISRQPVAPRIEDGFDPPAFDLPQFDDLTNQRNEEVVEDLDWPVSEIPAPRRRNSPWQGIISFFILIGLTGGLNLFNYFFMTSHDTIHWMDDDWFNNEIGRFVGTWSNNDYRFTFFDDQTGIELNKQTNIQREFIWGVGTEMIFIDFIINNEIVEFSDWWYLFDHDDLIFELEDGTRIYLGME